MEDNEFVYIVERSTESQRLRKDPKKLRVEAKSGGRNWKKKLRKVE